MPGMVFTGVGSAQCIMVIDIISGWHQYVSENFKSYTLHTIHNNKILIFTGHFKTSLKQHSFEKCNIIVLLNCTATLLTDPTSEVGPSMAKSRNGMLAEVAEVRVSWRMNAGRMEGGVEVCVEFGAGLVVFKKLLKLQPLLDLLPQHLQHLRRGSSPSPHVAAGQGTRGAFTWFVKVLEAGLRGVVGPVGVTVHAHTILK